jgi:3-oxoacyl-[acyl-carrier protein] reductase
MLLEGKVAILIGTGGKRGIGSGVAKVLAKNGATIAAFDKIEANALETVKIVEDLGGNAIAIKVDVTNLKELQESVKKVIEDFGRVDILVNLAGMYEKEDSKWWELDEKTFDRIISIQVKGLFNSIKSVVPYMIKRKSGKIINFSSQMSKNVTPGHITYSATKTFVNAATMGLARELGQYNINVNAISPGFVPTELNLPEIEKRAKELNLSIEECIQRIASNIPLKRSQETEDFGELVVFLASDKAKNITGQLIGLCGGMTPCT